MGVTLITGASSGIGRSLARRLARHEPVALIARRGELLASLAAEITAAGGRAAIAVADVTDRRALTQAIAAIETQLGPITRLIANAGGGAPTCVDAFDAAEIEAVIDLNLIGTVNTVAAVLPGMLARKTGHLVAIGSLAGSRGLPTAAAYSAAKGGLANFMESLRIDLRDRGVRVTLILPGFVATKPDSDRRRKEKPLTMALEAATARMEAAIIAGSPRLVLPRRLGFAVAVLRLLPCPYYDRALAGFGRCRPKKHGHQIKDRENL